jgi:hypothetical protein
MGKGQLAMQFSHLIFQSLIRIGQILKYFVKREKRIGELFGFLILLRFLNIHA